MKIRNHEMISIRNVVSIPILLVMILCKYCAGELVFLFLGGLATFYLIRNKGIRTEMPGFWIYVFMVCCGVLMGALHFKDTGYNFYAYFKHVYYVMFPFLMWYAGENTVKRERLSRETIYRSIVLATAAFCIWDLANFINVIIKLPEISNSSNLYQFRKQVGVGDFFTVIGLYILMFFQKELKLSKPIVWTASLCCGLSALVHFSRTALLMALVFSTITAAWMLRMRKQELNPKRILGACLIAGLLTGMVAITFPEIAGEFVSKIKNTFAEMSPFHEEWTFYRVCNSWRGYEVYCALVRFCNADLLEKLLGGGFGATLDMFGYAYLVTTEETLPFLHNGYFTQLMVFGIVGVIAMFGWFFSMWKTARTIRIIEDRVFVLGIVACIIFMTAIVGGPLFSPGMAQLIFLMALMVCQGNECSI